MPPAFNLSQDQTLQFNTCFAEIICVAQLKILTGKYLYTYLDSKCEQFDAFAYGTAT
jgi:hypothetical protein